MGSGDVELLYLFDSLFEFVSNLFKFLFGLVLFSGLGSFMLLKVVNNMFMLNFVKEIRFFIGGGLGIVGCSFGFGRDLGMGVIN